MPATTLKSCAAAWFAIGIALLMACSDDDRVATSPLSFTDTFERACHGTCRPREGCTFACSPETPPFQCPEDQVKGWVIRGTTAGDRHLEVCGGCRKGSIVGYAEPTCSAVVCDSNDDCAAVEAFACRAQRCVPE